MYDKILAVFSMALFGIFMLILALWVEEAPMLPFVLGATFLLGCYDFWLEVFSRHKREKDKNSLL